MRIYKIYTIFSGGRPRHIIKFLQVMKLTTILLLVTLVQVSATGLAQTITYKENNASLEQVFREIRRQTTFNVLASAENLAMAGKFDVNFQQTPLEEVLWACLKGTGLTYTIQKKTILIKERPKLLEQEAANIIQQQLTISGTVTDTTGAPLPGVAVQVKGTNKGAFTDMDGKYKLDNVEQGSVLVFSMLGFQNIEMPVADKDVINVILRINVSELDKVVVSTGYQTIPQERATGSFVQIDQDLINRSVSTNILQRLEGVVSGLIFNRDGKTEEDITIRGRTTIFANASPLIVVDGFPYDGDITNINPNNVENITVLRDAAAASIWGARAANGVIVITTKKGKNNQPVNISINSNLSITGQTDLMAESRVSSADYIEWQRFLFGEGYYTSTENSSYKSPLPKAVEVFIAQRDGKISETESNRRIAALGQIDTRQELMDHMFRDAVNQQYSLAIQGGSENISYYFSGGYDKNLSTRIGEDHQRISLRSSQEFTPIENLRINAGINYTQTLNHNNTINTAANLGFYDQLADENGNPTAVPYGYRLAWLEEPEQQRLLDWHYRPLQELALQDDVTKGYDTRINTRLRYQIIPAITADVRYQFQRYATNRRGYESEDTYFVRNLINRITQVNPDGTLTRPYTGGILNLSENELRVNTFRAQLNASEDWGEDHQLVAIAGMEIREAQGTGSSNRMYAYDDEYALVNTRTFNYDARYPSYINPLRTVGIRNSESVSGTIDRFTSYYANASYTYKNRYTVSGSARKDASNIFGVNTNQKGVPLWSTGFSWDLSKESFYHLDAFPYLRLRATYGSNGNVRTDATAFLTARYRNSTLTGLQYASITNPPNPDLRWEKVNMLNFAADFRSKNRIISGSLEFYLKKGVDLFGNIPLAPSTGQSSINTNSANTEVRGMDISLNTLNINRSFKWESNFLLSVAKEKVTSYLLEQETSSGLVTNSIAGSGLWGIYPVEGKPLNALYSYRWAGLDPQTGDPMGYYNGNPSSDMDKVYGITPIEDLDYHGPFAAPVFGSLRNTFSYKGWSLSANILYKFGHAIRRESLGFSPTHGDYYKRWQKPGDERFTDVPSFKREYPYDYSRSSFYLYSSATVINSDFIRLFDLRLSYAPQGLLRKLPFRNLEFYGYARNLGLLWTANDLGLDPESLRYPTPLSISIGLTANF